MDNQKLEKFNVIGISVRTTNEDGQSSIDVPALWQKFIKEGIPQKIPNKLSEVVYSIYTEYEKDHTKPYTAILGYAVSSLDKIPEGMVGLKIEEATYVKFTAKGSLQQNVIFNEWTKIWNSDIKRAFKADFEVYGEKAQNPENVEVDIFIGI